MTSLQNQPRLRIVGRLNQAHVSAIIALAEDNLEVVLTDERREHYRARHPDVAPYESRLADVLTDPDEVHRNATNL